MHQLDNYRKFLMNRVTTTPAIIEYIEKCLVTESEDAKHSFHKIMIQNWGDSDTQLFDMLSDYFGVVFIPVHYTTQNILTTFHTNSLMFILKVIKLDYMFPYSRNMFNIDILFNDKTSIDCFGEEVTIDDIVTKVVSSRLNEHMELNLSNFHCDPEFIEKKVSFYKLSLLSYFKILMLRMGRDTRILNLSNNKLSHIPSEILNFFIKGDLIGVNLSDNNIPSLSELHRISSRIEKLWIEGNPLCENMEPMPYIKQICQKFPRLTELDGVKLNNHGFRIPFYSNFLVVPDKRTKMFVEKFVSLYFAHYDSNRKKIDMFYSDKSFLTLGCTFTEVEDQSMEKFVMHSRNALDPAHKLWNFKFKRIYKNRFAIVGVLQQLPPTKHDPKTFTIDVLKHDNKNLILVIEGVYQEKTVTSERFIHFRRTFIFEIYTVNDILHYNICHEMFTVSFATPEEITKCFTTPIRHLNQLTLVNPEQEEKDILCAAFMHITQLKKSEAEARLYYHDWDFRVALKDFTVDLKNNKINADKLIDDDNDMSDLSSILDDEID